MKFEKNKQYKIEIITTEGRGVDAGRKANRMTCDMCRRSDFKTHKFYLSNGVMDLCEYCIRKNNIKITKMGTKEEKQQNKILLDI